MRVWSLAVLVLLGLSACNKGKDKKDDGPRPNPVATIETGKRDAEGVRSIEIEAGKEGYVPVRIPGKPGEKLKLVFTRRASGGECMAQLRQPDGKVVELPIDKPYEVAVIVPDEGEVTFACGMDMFTGVVVAEKA
jgi:plastocyanin domain-containing protein